MNSSGYSPVSTGSGTDEVFQEIRNGASCYIIISFNKHWILIYLIVTAILQNRMYTKMRQMGQILVIFKLMGLIEG
jgi:hypothetical protein